MNFLSFTHTDAAIDPCVVVPPLKCYNMLFHCYFCLCPYNDGLDLPQYPSGHFSLSSPWHVCPNTCFSRTTCSLSTYKVKGELDCFNCKTGVFIGLLTSVFTKESNYNRRSPKKSTSLWGIFDSYKEKLSVPRVHTMTLTESYGTTP